MNIHLLVYGRAFILVRIYSKSQTKFLVGSHHGCEQILPEPTDVRDYFLLRNVNKASSSSNAQKYVIQEYGPKKTIIKIDTKSVLINRISEGITAIQWQKNRSAILNL